MLIKRKPQELGYWEILEAKGIVRRIWPDPSLYNICDNEYEAERCLWEFTNGKKA